MADARRKQGHGLPLDWRDSRSRRRRRRGSADAEHTLIKGLRQGDNDAYTALYDTYGPRILSFVTRILGEPRRRHDVTQEVFLKAFRRLPDDSRELALKSWLYKVASTTCLDHLRARSAAADRRRTSTAKTCRPRGDGFERAEINGLMQEALDRLSDRHRLVLILKDLHGLRHEEIAGILGVSRGATETLLFRARAAFRQAYLERCGDRREPASRCPSRTPDGVSDHALGGGAAPRWHCSPEAVLRPRRRPADSVLARFTSLSPPRLGGGSGVIAALARGGRRQGGRLAAALTVAVQVGVVVAAGHWPATRGATSPQPRP